MKLVVCLVLVAMVVVAYAVTDEFEPKHCQDRAMCAMYCENGFQRGEDGCVSCTCNPDLLHCAQRVSCRMFCENGRETGPDGCDVCKCRQL